MGDAHRRRRHRHRRRHREAHRPLPGEVRIHTQPGERRAGAQALVPRTARGGHLGGCMLFMILVVLLVLSLAGGGWGHSRYGYTGWSPAGLIVLVFVIFWLTGNLHLG